MQYKPTNDRRSPAQAVKHHPASVDLELVKRLIATTKCSTLLKFLATEFTSISRDLAGETTSTSSGPGKSFAASKPAIRSY